MVLIRSCFLFICLTHFLEYVIMKSSHKNTVWKEKNMKRAFCTLLALVMLLLCVGGCNNSLRNAPESTTEATVATDDIKAPKYDEAISLLEKKDLEAAYKIFLELGDYKDAANQLKKFVFMPTSQVSLKSGATQTVECTLDDKGFPIKVIINDYTGRSTTHEYTYNEDGNFLKNIKTATNFNQSFEYEYDTNGKIIKETFVGNTGITRITEHTYDQSGILTNTVITVNNDLLYRYEYTYTASKKIASKISVSSDGTRDIIDEYDYDDNDRLIRTKTLTGDNGTIMCTYEYNTVGLKSKQELFYNDETTPYYVYEYFYDANGNILKEECKSKDASGGHTTEYEYDEAGNQIRLLYSYGVGDAKTPDIEQSYTYDDKSNVINKKYYSHQTKYYEYDTFVYDDYGNAIKKTHITSSALHEKTETEYKLVYLPCGLTDNIKSYFSLLVK